MCLLRAYTLADFVHFKPKLGWERFEADELSEVLKARGIIYRRRGNVHGFDGLRLKDEADDE